MNLLIIVLFCIFSLVLAVYSLVLLLFAVHLPIILLLGAIPKGFLYSILTIIKMSILPVFCEFAAAYIWLEVFEQLRESKADTAPEFKRNVICMIILTVIMLSALVSVDKSMQRTKEHKKRYEAESQQMVRELEQKRIEDNKNAAQNCRKVRGLCVTRQRISFKRGDTFGESLSNAKNVCSGLGMRLPTKDEFDVILLPLTTFKYKLEHNPTDEEFVVMERYYKKTLRDYHLQFWSDNFFTSSVKNGQAITYKVDLKRYYNYDGCRKVNTRNVSGGVCISETVDTPHVEYHDFDEPTDKTRYTDYSLHCVK